MSSESISPKVYYQLDDSVPQKLPFYQCALELFGENGMCIDSRIEDVGHSYTNDNLILSRKPQGLILYHPLNCPLVHYKDGQLQDSCDRRNDDVRVGSAVLVRSCDGMTLITRRSKKLRTFPGIWVPAGGHVEPGETLEDAAVRELGEEVGITLTLDEFKIKSLCLFESCFPPFLEWGAPKRHHLVVYHVMYCSLPWEQLQNKIQINEDEVDACAWIPDEMLAMIVARQQQPKQKQQQPQQQQILGKITAIQLTTIEGGVSSSHQVVDPSVFTANVTSQSDHDVERLSTGTAVALTSLSQQLQVQQQQPQLNKL